MRWSKVGISKGSGVWMREDQRSSASGENYGEIGRLEFVGIVIIGYLMS